MRKKEIKCPYCGSKAKLVHFMISMGRTQLIRKGMRGHAQDFHSAILM